MGTILVAGLAGSVSAWVTSVMLAPADAKDRAPAHIVGAPALRPAAGSEATAGLRAEVTELEEHHAALSARLMTLEQTLANRVARDPRSAGETDPALPGRIEPLASRARPEAAEEPDASGPFVDTVYSALQEIRADEERERDVLRQEAREARVEARLERLVDQIGIGGYQMDQMRELLLWRETTRDELRAAEGLRDREGIKEDYRAMREETEDRLAGILLPEQLDAYRKSEQRRDRKEPDRRAPTQDEQRQENRRQRSERGSRN